MKNKIFLIILFTILSLTISLANSHAEETTQPISAPTQKVSGGVLQTQMGMAGNVEVDVIQAKIIDNILTIVLSYRNTGSTAAKVTYAVDEVYYIDDTEKKKYHVLKDDKNEWIAAPVARGAIGIGEATGVFPVKVEPNSKANVWFKFPAPPESVTKINLVVPDALPFDNLEITR